MKKVFLGFMFLMLAALNSFATTLPVHHAYTEYFGNTRGFIKNHDIHLTWNKDPDASKMGYYAQYAFYFEVGVVGYMGLQKDKEGKKAIFSIWDKPNAITATPSMPWCKRFGHEGSGAQCIIPFDWKAGREYKIRVWQINEPGAEKWGAWVIDYATGEETLIGVIGTQGYGGLKTYSIGVIENYGPGDAGILSCDAFKDLSVTWKGPYYNNGSTSASNARVKFNTSIGDSCIHQSNIETSTIGVVKMSHGKGVVNSKKEGDEVWDNYQVFVNQQYDCLFNWAEQQMPDVFDQRPFRHRRLSTQVINSYIRDYRDGGVGNALIVDKLRNLVIVGRADGTYVEMGDVKKWLEQSQCFDPDNK